MSEVIENCTPGKAVLDIGCNKGYFSRELLLRGLAQSVDAIEYDPAIVPGDLKLDCRFSLHSGDALTFTFPRQYHATIYGALHHHLFALHGYSRAMQFWLNIVEHTESLIFIESGQLAEGSRWYWQRALREYYSSDEDYFSDLLLAIGPRLKAVDLIGRNWIHGVCRWLFRIELWPSQRSRGAALSTQSIDVERTFRRTIGSARQELISKEDSRNVGVHEGLHFRVGHTRSGEKVFCKKYLATQKGNREFSIGAQIFDPRFVVPIDHTSEHGLIFPFIDLPILESVPRTSISDKSRLRSELMTLFRFASDKCIIVDICGRREFKLIDVIDLHSSNFFYDDTKASLRVIDLEVHSLENRYRNKMNLANIMLRWCEWDLVTATTVFSCIISYSYHLLVTVWRPPERRVVERTVSALGWAHMQLREKLDKLIITFIPEIRQ